MFSLYSKSCEYTLQALVAALRNRKPANFRIKELCHQNNLPESFTRKAFQKLAKEGILEPVYGPGGGYRFKRAANNISILDIVQCLDGENTFDQCVMGLPECGDEDPCAFHHVWKDMKKTLLRELSGCTLTALSKSKKGRQ